MSRNQNINFDGSDDCIEIPSDIDINILKNLTISQWVPEIERLAKEGEEDE